MKTPTRERTPEETANLIKQKARDIGFDDVAVTPARDDSERARRLDAFLARHYHGSMAWMETRKDQRASPLVLWPDARSIIMVAMNYGPDHDPLTILEHKNLGAVSVYAQNRDYHDIIKKRMKQMARWMVAEFGGDLKVFVDTAPVMEKPLAEQAGLGWQGKHTNLVSREFGSWLFLGAIFSTLDLSSDAPEIDHCGSCTACLDICPTNAFPAPYQLDARRCISYLTIEHKGPIPIEFRKSIGNRIYGCDDCLAVCPWNKFARNAGEIAFHSRDDIRHAPLERLLALDDAAFRQMFSGSPIKRIGRDRFIRNVLIAAGNSHERSLLPAITALLDDPDNVVQDAAQWALRALSEKSID